MGIESKKAGCKEGTFAEISLNNLLALFLWLWACYCEAAEETGTKARKCAW